MNLINRYKIKYINHLLGSKGVVLRGDSSRGDSPIMEVFHNDNYDLILQVKEGIEIEEMRSNPGQGAKERLDIHFGTDLLNEILTELREFTQRNGLVMDSKSYQILDPSGTEHSDGLPLGKVEPITRLPAYCSVHYESINAVAQSSMIYVDAENYPDKQRYHIGSSTKSVDKNTSGNLFEVIIPSEYVCRFIKSIELAVILLK